MPSLSKRAKPTVAFFDFTGCEGCQLTVIDALQTHAELLDAVEIVNFREALSEKSDHYQIAFVEGSCTRKSDEARLLSIREQAGILVALGACAHIGGVNAIRKGMDMQEVRRLVYRDFAETFETADARPVEEIVEVDAVLPGCPIDREEFVRILKTLLQGRRPQPPSYPICMECKLKEVTCLFTLGKACLGPVTRAGCGAICPSFGMPCEGCRGLIPSPNLASLREVFGEYEFDEQLYQERMRTFLTYQYAKGG
jgi:sulfhydrogenase subunit delta